MLEVQSADNDSGAEATAAESDGGRLQIQQGAKSPKETQVGYVSEIRGCSLEEKLYQLQQEVGLFCRRILGRARQGPHSAKE